ncbi:MAG TPA: dihydroneopterin aldolase [Acidimicrobiales bacterium]
MAPTDRIELRGLVISGICGALPEERERAQPLEIDLDVTADLAVAGGSDDLDDTLDYGAITEQVERVVTSGTPMLLERLAEAIAETVLADERALVVTVAVRKLRPPVPQVMGTSGVRITRERG